MPILAVQLFNHSAGDAPVRRSLRRLGQGRLHRLLHGEVRLSTPVGARAPFYTPSRARRLVEGRAEFEIPASPPTLELFTDVEIALYPATLPVGRFGQRFLAPSTPLVLRARLDLRRPGAITGQPIPGDAWSGQGGLHPRLVLDVDPAQRGLSTVWVDVTFFDVTSPLRLLQAEVEAEVGRRRGDERSELERRAFWLKPVKQECPSPSGLVDVSEASDIVTRVLEYTGGPPAAWVVMIPRRYPRPLSALGYLTFFRPEIGHYTAPPYMDLERVFRYWRMPPVGFPWFIAPQPPPRAEDTALAPMASAPNPCGWLGQLANAQELLRRQGRNAPIVVNPVPDGIEYGAVATFGGLSHALQALTRLLKAESLVGGGVAERPSRIGICGFSAGGGALFSVLADFLAQGSAAQRASIDEIYCFDPTGFTAAQANLERWLRARPDRRLRLFAGDQQQAMRGLLHQLDRTRASLHPESSAFWSQPLYLDALSIPLHRRPNRTPFQHFHEDPPDGFQRTSRIVVSGARHQWAVGGGTGSSLRDASFTGHLEMALRNSGF